VNDQDAQPVQLCRGSVRISVHCRHSTGGLRAPELQLPELSHGGGAACAQRLHPCRALATRHLKEHLCHGHSGRRQCAARQL
jgi:hypothetical protein